MAEAEARRVPPPAADTPPDAAPVAWVGLPIAPRRASLSDAELPLADAWVYIGRGSVKHGLGRSPWANPCVNGVHGGRHEVIKRFTSYLDDSQHLLAGLSSLSGCVLVCATWTHHCGLHSGLPRGGQPRRRDVIGRRGRLGVGWLDEGPPIHVGRRAKWRDIKEGGGPCCPERWLPERRRLPPAGADLGCRLARLADDQGIGREGVRRLLAQLASGPLEDDPSPALTQAGCALVHEFVREQGQQVPRAGRVHPAPVVDFDAWPTT